MLTISVLALLVAKACAGSAIPVEAFASSTSPPTVTIKNGTVTGYSIPDLKAETFLGIPYAQAPRFGNPLPINTSFSGTFDASTFGDICPGYGISSTANASTGQNYVISEDCLNINIVRPAGTSNTDKLPVLLWIFGGGLVQGASSDPRYNGTYLVQTSVELGKPIIFASINYRLAAFGFPAGEAASDAGVLNLGYKDQRQALNWLQENVGAFGGDKDKVTIWGQSAGGGSVVAQLTAYGGVENPPFRAAISDSGVFATQNASLASQAPAWSRFLNATGCSDDLACLRALPFDQIFAAANGTFSPAAIPDGDFIPMPNWKAFKAKKFSKVPFILGHNLDEATAGIGAPIGINNDTQFDQAVARGFSTLSPSNETISQFDTIFPNDPALGCPFGTGEGVLPTGLQDKRINWVYTDSVAAGVRYLAKQFSGAAPTYKYHFTQVPQNGTIDLGVAHFYEVPYVFGIMNQTARNPMSQRSADLVTSRNMQEYWINFVHDLVPKAKNGPTWNEYSEGQKALTIKNNATQMDSDSFRKESVSFLIDLASRE